jgi:hypothetical protein
VKVAVPSFPVSGFSKGKSSECSVAAVVKSKAAIPRIEYLGIKNSECLAIEIS